MDDLTGKKFGKLLVLKKSERKAASGAMYDCKCDCGSFLTVARCSLTSGHTKSRGCTTKKFLSSEKPSKTHGFSKGKDGKCERLYRVWLGMRQRCNNRHSNSYSRYGGRGIRICDEWNDYSTFREWALLNGYDEKAPRGKCTIDRIDNDGMYSPQNCRFANMSLQRMNQERSKHGKE